MNIIPPSAYDIYCMYICIYAYIYMWKLLLNSV